MEKHHTERVYDDEMAPLVAKLIEIAKREGIPLLVSAGMLCERDGEMEPTACSTKITSDNTGENPQELAGIRNRYALALCVIRGHAGFDTAAGLMITRHHPSDGSES